MTSRLSFKLTSLSLAIAGCLFSFNGYAQSAPDANQEASQQATETAEFLKTIPWDSEYDVVVLGYGFAGGSAAVAAADKGAKVLLSEKAPEGKEGGNSKYSAQGALFVDKNVPDEEVLKYFQALRGKNQSPSDEVYKAFIKGAKEQPDYLLFLGADKAYTKPMAEFPEFEGSRAIGTVRVKMPGGDAATYNLLQDNVKKRADNIDVWFNSPGKKLIQDPKTGIVHGVIIEIDGQPKYVRAKNGVVLATGGFENNPEMFRNYVGVQDAYAKGAHFNTGEGVNMAMDVGANMINMSGVAGPDPNVINPATGNSFGYIIAGDKRMDKAWKWNGPIFTYHDVIMVGPDGKRFWNETTPTRHGRYLTHGEYLPLRMPSPAFMIFDEDARNASKVYGAWSEGAEKEIESGLVKKADTIEELAKIIGVDVQGLVEEVNRYNQFSKEGKDADFDRNAEYLNPLDHGPFYAVEVVPTYTNTQGGPERNENAEILDRNGKPIPHLYGAGELGSIFTHYYNGGGNIGESLVFGRIAGANAADQKADISQNSVLGDKPGFRPTIAQQGRYVLEDGEQLGIGKGIGGDIVLAVKSDNGKIISVRVLKHGETEGIGTRALEVLPGQAVANNGQVDNYSGASASSSGFKEALADALNKYNK